MNKVRAVCDAFDLNYEAVAGIPKITILGDEKVYIENYVSLEEYRDDNIKLKCKNHLIEILGCGFQIKNIREGCIEINGKIASAKII